MPRVNLPVAQQLPSVPSMETINGVAAVDAEDLARDVISRRHGQVRHGRRHLLHATSGSWGKKRLAGHSEPVYCVLSASSMAFLRFRSRARDHVWALVFFGGQCVCVCVRACVCVCGGGHKCNKDTQ